MASPDLSDPDRAGASPPAATARVSGKGRRYLRRVIIAVLSLLAVTEIAARTMEFELQPMLIADPVLGYRLRPGASGRSPGDGFGAFTVNAAGWRDVERTPEKPESTLRIAVLGDGFCQATEVDQEQAFWWILERELAAEPSFARWQNIEVLGFGVEGYGTAQELLMLREHVWQYSPDLVLLAFSPGSDVRNNSREVDADDDRPYFVYRDNRLVLDQSFRDSALYRQRCSTGMALLRMLGDVSRAVQVSTRRARWFRALDPIAGDWEPNSGVAVLGEPTDPAWHRAWRVTEGLIRTMRREVEAHGARFGVIVTTIGLQAHVVPGPVWTFVDDSRVTDVRYPSDRIVQFCGAEAIAVCDLRQPMSDFAQANLTVLHGVWNRGRGYWNVWGHQTAGRFVAQWLVDHDVASWFE